MPAKFLHLFRIDDDVLLFGVLIARDDFFRLEFTVMRAHLAILDRAVALSMKLIEPDLSTAGRSGIRFDRYRDETEPR